MLQANPSHPCIAQLLTAEVAADAARVEHRRRELARHRGVAWSGLTPEPAEPRSLASLYVAAESRLTARERWGASLSGRLIASVGACQAAAQRAHAAGERVRAGASRGEPAEWCRLALDDLSNEVHGLMVSLDEARRLLG